MISFEDIDKHSWWYDLYMKYLCAAHNHVYYRNFYIVNKENIPPKGTPTFVIANHQNGMMDAMAILHTMYKDGRQPVFIARGDIFKKDFVARIMRFLKILPVYRNRDGGREDIKKDLAIFNRAARVLKKGGTLVIFPEAGHQHGHYMSTFKKGFSRIAFAAEEMNDFKLGVQILPLNIHYSNYFNFQSDLMVTCGKPFTYDEFFELYKEAPNQAYLALNEKARARVKEMTPDIDIPEYYNEIEALTHIMSEPLLRRKGLRPRFLPNQKDAAMTIIAAIRHLKEDNLEDFTMLMEDTRQYTGLLQRMGLHHWVVNRKISWPKLILRIFLMILTLPLFLFGYLNNFLPDFITQRLTHKIKDPMMHSTFQYAIGTLATFPIWYIFMLVLVSLLTHHFWIGLIYITLAGVIGILNVHYKRSLRKLGTTFKALRLRRTEKYKTLCDLNTRIIDRMEGLLY